MNKFIQYREGPLHSPVDVLIVLMSRAAEGTPKLALALSRHWIASGIRPVIIVMQNAPNDLASEFRQLGLECVSLQLSERGYARYIELSWKIFRISRAYRPKALLSMPLGWHAFMAIGARLAGVHRIVAHVGNYPNVNAAHAFRKFRFLVQLGRPFTDRLICCSRYVRSGAIRHFRVSEAETAVIYNGVPIADFERTSSKPQHTEANTPFTIGMVATLEIHKDQPTLIEAARILKLRGRKFKVWFIGEGSRRRELEQRVEAADVADIVTFLGMRKDVAKLIGEMDLFAFSTTADEGLGIALIEAMASRVPVVASNVGACREVLDDGEAGTLVAAANPTALADAIDAIIADPNNARIRAGLAHAKAHRTFSIAEMADQYAAELGLPRPEARKAQSLSWRSART